MNREPCRNPSNQFEVGRISSQPGAAQEILVRLASLGFARLCSASASLLLANSIPIIHSIVILHFRYDGEMGIGANGRHRLFRSVDGVELVGHSPGADDQLVDAILVSPNAIIDGYAGHESERRKPLACAESNREPRRMNITQPLQLVQHENG